MRHFDSLPIVFIGFSFGCQLAHECALVFKSDFNVSVQQMIMISVVDDSDVSKPWSWEERVGNSKNKATFLSYLEEGIIAPVLFKFATN